MGFARRAVMALVGGGLLAVHLAAAYVVYAAMRTTLRDGDLPTLAAGVVVAAVALGYLSYRVGTGRLLAGLDAVEPPRDRVPGLYRLRDDLADRMGIDPPRLLVGRLGAPNAVAIGGVGDTVVIDAALVHLLDRDELRAIVAHEFAHLESYDGLVATVVHSVVQALAGIALVVALPVVLALSGLAYAAAWGRGRPGDWPRTLPGRLRRRLDAGLATIVLASTILLLARSRRREFAADDRAAEVTGDPLALARALRKIERAARPGFGLLVPLSSREEEGIERLLATHPPTDDRVDRLLERADRTVRRIEIR